MTKEQYNPVAVNYDASQIQILEGLEGVRRRPGMYIGSTGSRGLHHLVYEIVDNSIDEALAGFCDTIQVTINDNESITVSDNGRGIPVGIHEKTGKPAVEAALTMLHAGGKFGGGGYKVSGGLHGVGMSVVNALSSHLEVQVSQGGFVYRQEYRRGKPLSDLTKIGPTKATGTTITFQPDTDIFEETEYSKETLASRLRELAFLNKGLKIELTDKRDDSHKSFSYEGGVRDFVE
ncbi:MAG: DNA topoisomerase IV subunit B, partial [Clostridiales bacterium]|nr:DNA topoisomerase IV subunit B [Clostridiales bacterium]